jgi:hypothetical protein
MGGPLISDILVIPRWPGDIAAGDEGAATRLINLRLRQWLRGEAVRRRLAELVDVYRPGAYEHDDTARRLPEAALLCHEAHQVAALARYEPCPVGFSATPRPWRDVLDHLVVALGHVVHVIASWDPADLPAPIAGQIEDLAGPSRYDRLTEAAAAAVPQGWLDHLTHDIAHQLLGGAGRPHDPTPASRPYTAT